ncbi:hypothetical protein PRIPAC_79256 [Pristionchus pacificus]|nr:hypothetical protein PRIPAC_79256 [Pristionchus pacificus]
MEVINFALFLITIRIVQIYSSPSFGPYKYCIYQIIIMSLLSQQISLFGPVFYMPLLGGYVTVELFVSPMAIHTLFSIWICLTFLDLESIMDGFNFRCRVLLKTFHPQFTNKYFWIGISIFAKTATVTIIVSMFLPLGFRLEVK